MSATGFQSRLDALVADGTHPSKEQALLALVEADDVEALGYVAMYYRLKSMQASEAA